MTTKADKKERNGLGGKKVGGGKNQLLGRYLRQVAETATKNETGNNTSEEEGGESEGEVELKLPEVIRESLNLSKKRIKEFPTELLPKMQQIQFLYLEGNKLTELPQNFFQSLPSVKWLDLRNNYLNSLPVPGLKHHNTLEVILLQGNRIRNLPVELSTISTLKGIQTAGNPITNVPYEIIAEGFQSVIKHLKKLQAQEDNLLSVSDPIVVKASTSKGDTSEVKQLNESESRAWDSDKLSQWRHFIRKKSETLKQTNLQHKLHKNANERRFSQQPKISISVRSQPKPPPKVQPFRCGVYNRNRHRALSSALRFLKMRKTRLGYKRNPITPEMIQQKARNEVYRAQVREVLESQARKIQRMRDKDVLKNWRNHTRLSRYQIKLLDNYQEYPSKNFADRTPFDVDPEFLNMLNRVDLYKSLKDYDNRSKKKRKPKSRITTLDLEVQMNEIIKKLKTLDTNEVDKNSSPRSKHTHMCSKMDKIMDIQKTLKNLQKLNSLIISPAVKTKPKE